MNTLQVKTGYLKDKAVFLSLTLDNHAVNFKPNGVTFNTIADVDHDRITEENFSVPLWVYADFIGDFEGSYLTLSSAISLLCQVRKI